MRECSPSAGALLDELRQLDSCAVSDALDLLGHSGAALGLAPLWPCGDVVVGRARTVQAAPRCPDSPGTHIASPVVANARPQDVVVIANGGREDVSCWGGLLATAAVRRRVAGVVIDGACRDISDSARLSLPIYGRQVVPVSARGRIVQIAMDEPVTIAGVQVARDDYVIADASGVVFVPAARAAEVIALGARIKEREAQMEAAVRAGDSIETVMHDSRFPALAPDS